MISPDGKHSAVTFIPAGATDRGKGKCLVIDDIAVPFPSERDKYSGRLTYTSPTTFHSSSGRRPANNMRLNKWTLVPAEPAATEQVSR